MATRRPTPQGDPLADLRDVPAPTDYYGPVDVLEAAGGGQAAGGLPAVADQAWHDDAATRVVNRWHVDITATRTLHKGGGCSCRYLAVTALAEAVGVVLPEAASDG